MILFLISAIFACTQENFDVSCRKEILTVNLEACDSNTNYQVALVDFSNRKCQVDLQNTKNVITLGSSNCESKGPEVYATIYRKVSSFWIETATKKVICVDAIFTVLPSQGKKGAKRLFLSNFRKFGQYFGVAKL